MGHDEEKLIDKYVEALGEEYEAFYMYKEIFKHEVEHPRKSRIMSIMEEEFHHYEIIYDMLFPSDSHVVHTLLEDAFKKELHRMKEEMSACLEKMRRM